MLGKYLIAAVLLVTVCLGALVFYEWIAVETPAAWQLIETWTGTIEHQIVLPRELTFETISHGFLHQDHKYFVIDNSEEWEELALTSPPDIDFSTHLIIATLMAQCPNSGYSISIERIVEIENEIQVEVRESYPGRIDVWMIITYPSHIVKIERVQKPIVFKVQQFMEHRYDENWKKYDGIIHEFLGEYHVEPGSGPPEPE